MQPAMITRPAACYDSSWIVKGSKQIVPLMELRFPTWQGAARRCRVYKDATKLLLSLLLTMLQNSN